MTSKTPRFDKSYLAGKRRQLEELRDQLRSTAKASEEAEAQIQDESGVPPRESQDDAQRLDRLEIEGTLVSRDVQRLARVQRALEKIVEGTYGYSDASGNTIPDDRLEAVPEAVNTLAEQEVAEASTQRHR